MQTFFEILNIITNNSIQLVLSGVLIYALVLVIQYYKIKMFNSLENKIEVGNLHNHPIFDRTENLVDQIDYTLDFGEGRSKLVQDIIDKKYEISLKYFAKMVNDIEQDKNDNIEFHKLHMEYKNKIESEFSNLSNYDISCQEEREALKVCIKEFQKFQHHREEFLMDISSNIQNSSFYGSNQVKLYALMNTYMGVFIDLLHDAKLTLNNINGRISGKTYKGCKIQKLEGDDHDD